MNNIVIVGGGQAGVQLADSLRVEGYGGNITLFADEAHLPYQRPPLSKDFMAAGDNADALPLRADKFFAERAVDFRQGIKVTGLDRERQIITADDGSETSYSKLVLATGARNRKLEVDGADLDGVHYLRTLDDAAALQKELSAARRAVVIGAGFIGLEFAAAARQRGLEVTVLEYASRPMARVLSEPMSEYFADSHANNGIDLKFGEGIASFKDRAGRVTTAIGSTGQEYPADIVLIGIGVIPNTEIAQDAGLEANNGILVDAELRTSDPSIYALGDCCSYPQNSTGTRTRLESVQNATDQAKCLSKTLLGSPTIYSSLPWFWSQQGKVKLQIAGLISADDETVLRGDPNSGKFSVYCFRGGELIGVESVNSPADHMAARRLLTQKRPLTPAQAADTTFNVKEFSKG